MHLEACGQCAPLIIRSGVGGQCYSRSVSPSIGAAGAYLVNQLIAVLLRHRKIGYQYIWPPVIESIEGFGYGSSGDDVGAGIIQDSFEQIPRILVVLDNQDTHMIQSVGLRLNRDSFGRLWLQLKRRKLRWLYCHERQCDLECRAVSSAGTAGRNRAAVHLDDMTYDSESQPKPSVPASGRTVGLAESFEEIGQKLWLYADATVGNRYFGLA